MKLMHPRYLLLWALALLPVAAALWYAGGPFLLRRAVEIPLVAKSVPGPVDSTPAVSPQDVSPAASRESGWTLEWADSSGNTINGRWLDLKPEQNGNLDHTIETIVPNYEFDSLVLRWHAMPGVAIQEPTAASLIERVAGIETRSELKVRPDYIEGTSAANGLLQSAGAEGGVAWRMPAFTIAQAQDILAVYGLLITGFLVLWVAYHLGDGRRWYTPERAALLLVVLVHTWLAVRAPLMYCPDSVDYVVNTKLLLDNRSFDHFNAWRLPGYSVFLTPFVAGLYGFNFALGLVQGLLTVLAAWLAGSALKPFLSPAWAALATLVVGLDPVLLMFTRHAMPECLAAFMTMMAVWAALKGQFWSKGSWPAVVAGAIGLGTLLGAACYVRGNLLVVAAALPFAAAAWPLAEGLRARAGVLFALILLTAVGVIAPWVVNNHDRYQRAQFVVGAGFTRAYSAIESGLIDLNQSAAFTQQKWDMLRDQSVKRDWTATMSDIESIKDTDLAQRTQSLPAWTRQDERANAVARESIARNPHARWLHSLRAFVNLIGLWPIDAQENRHWATELRMSAPSASNHRTKPTDFSHLPKDAVQDAFSRTETDIGAWTRTDQANVYDSLWRFAEAVRPLWAVLVFVALLGALGRRQWALFIIAAMVLGHAAYLSSVLLTGIDRYQVPLYPVMTLLAVYGAACLAGAAPMAEHGRVQGGNISDASSRTTRFR